jgi:hypothetical protein
VNNKDDKETLAVLGWLLKHPKIVMFLIVLCVLAGIGIGQIIDAVKFYLGF